MNQAIYPSDHIFTPQELELYKKVEQEESNVVIEYNKVDKLDELDPIEHEYVLDVCSPGAERPIRNKEEFLANLNEYISVYLDEEDENKKGSVAQ